MTNWSCAACCSSTMPTGAARGATAREGGPPHRQEPLCRSPVSHSRWAPLVPEIKPSQRVHQGRDRRLERQVYRAGSHVVSDGLSCFPAVTDNQCRYEPIITHKNGRCDDKMVFQWLNTVLGNVKNALHGTCRVIWPSSATASTTASSWTRWWIGYCKLLCTLSPFRSGCSS